MSRVLLAMSGGIDSSVSAVLLREAGHEVTGVFMRHGVRAEAASRPGKQGCCSLDDAHDARRVADRLGIPFYVLNFEREFARVVDYFVGEYARGATPNPCIVCNRDLKFGRLFEVADAIGAELVATGHYARVEVRDGDAELRRGRDRRKDQSYVLFPLERSRLARCRFPVGDLEKHETREIARRAGLSIADKPDSQEICFVPGGDYRPLVRERLGESLRPGEFRSAAGEPLGEHEGHALFTVGQRRGLGRAFGRPQYVVGIDASTGTVTLGDREALASRSLEVRDVNWLVDSGGPIEAIVRIRTAHEGTAATVHPESGNRARVEFHEPAYAVTPGQAAVFYDGDRVLGGGWIAS